MKINHTFIICIDLSLGSCITVENYVSTRHMVAEYRNHSTRLETFGSNLVQH